MGAIEEDPRLVFASDVALFCGEGFNHPRTDPAGDEVIGGDIAKPDQTVPRGPGSVVRIRARPSPDPRAMVMGRLRGGPDQLYLVLRWVTAQTFKRRLGYSSSGKLLEGGFAICNDCGGCGVSEKGGRYRRFFRRIWDGPSGLVLG